MAWQGLHDVPAMWGPDTLSHPGFFLLPPQLSNLPSSPASERTGESVAVVARQGLHDVPAMWGPRGDLAVALDAMDKLWPPVLQGKGVPVVLVQFLQHPGLKEHSYNSLLTCSQSSYSSSIILGFEWTQLQQSVNMQPVLVQFLQHPGFWMNTATTVC